MARQLFQWPSATTYGTIPANTTQDILIPATMVDAYQDYSFEVFYPTVSVSNTGTFAAIYRTLTNAATASVNQEAVGNPMLITSQTGSTAFVRDIYGLITKQIIVRVTAGAADIQLRVSALGVS